MLTPEQEEYRKQQRQEAGEQMDQMARNANAAKAIPEDGVDYAPVNADVPETTDDTELTVLPSETAPTAPTEERRIALRKLYANDNEGYKQALANEGFDNEETNGVQSIMQAYYAGKIDKNTRDYMMADAIAKFARNTGRDIGNIGAQFTGGAINNNYETSEWNKRNSALAGNETTARLAEQEGSEANLKRQSDILDIAAKGLNNELANMKLTVPRVWKGLVDNADNIDNPILKAAVKGSAQTMLDKSVNGGEVTAPAMIAAIVANGGNELAEAAEKAGKSVEQYVADAVKGFIPSMAPSLNINAGTNIASIFGDDSSETGPLERPEENGNMNPNKGSDAAHSNSASQFSDANKNKLYDEIAGGRKNSDVARQIMSQTDANTDDSFTSLPPEKQQAWLDIFEYPTANKWFNKSNKNIESAMSLMEKEGPDAVKKLVKEQVYPSLNRQYQSNQAAINALSGYNSVGVRNDREALQNKQTELMRQMEELNKW